MLKSRLTLMVNKHELACEFSFICKASVTIKNWLPLMAGWVKKRRRREEEQIEERTYMNHMNGTEGTGQFQFFCRSDLQSETSTVSVSLCFFLLKRADAVSSSTAAGKSTSK